MRFELIEAKRFVDEWRYEEGGVVGGYISEVLQRPLRVPFEICPKPSKFNHLGISAI